jgi:hypothetical protein
VDAVAAPQLRRIAFVTGRFLELQGLLPAAFGMALVFGCLVVRTTGEAGRHVGETQGVLFAAIYSGFAGREILASYRRVHGDAVGTIRQKFFATLPTMVVMLGAILDMLSRDASRPGPSAASLALIAFSGWIVVRDWPWRMHHLVGVAAGVMGALVTASAPVSVDRWGIDPARAEIFVIAYMLIGLSMAATGLLDHLLLTQSLALTSEPPPHGRPLLRAGVAIAFCIAGGIAMRDFHVEANFVLSAALLLAVLAVQVGVSIRDINAWARAVNAGERASGPGGAWIPADVLALSCALTIAAAIDTALLRYPVVLTVTIAVASVWFAFRRRPGRWHYLLGALAASAALVLMPRVGPPRAVALLIFATAGAVAIQALVDHWLMRHAHTI